mmetsp:Transcript_26218/g.41041  ORF Transcript_26218/g.41041 Transcript_26218/m.41041 type:complete len:83 (+) Transcript_26218:977-1225(+)
MRLSGIEGPSLSNFSRPQHGLLICCPILAAVYCVDPSVLQPLSSRAVQLISCPAAQPLSSAPNSQPLSLTSLQYSAAQLLSS